MLSSVAVTKHCRCAAGSAEDNLSMIRVAIETLGASGARAADRIAEKLPVNGKGEEHVGR